MQNNYKNLIFTNHALGRLSERGFTQDMTYQTFSNPDKQEKGKENGTTEFTKRFDNHMVTVITKQNEKYEWVILSCWMEPPLPGTRDAKLKEEYKRYQDAGFWGKLFLTAKRQIFNR